MVIEAKALTTLLGYVLREEPCEDVAGLVAPIFESHQAKDAESWLRHFAMARLLKETLTVPELEPAEDLASRLFARTAKAWMLWAAGRTEEAKTTLRTSDPAGAVGSEIHMMTLGPWWLGVDALLREDSQEARRYFRRSTEMGSQLGTETNNAIQWSFVATFHKS